MTINVWSAEEKLRAREQWTNDPCGAEYEREHEFGSDEYFASIEAHRYNEYAPWMRARMGFDDFPGASLLEIGCGMGSDLVQFARGGAHCTGIDLTPRSIEITRHRFQLNKLAGNFMICDAESLPFANASFDVVYSNGVLHHTPDTAGAVREIFRVLRDAGTAKVMLYHRSSLNYWFEIVIRRGVFAGEFIRGRSAEEIMSRVVEHSEHEARPLVKVFSKKEARELFAQFANVKIEVDQLMRAELRFLSPLVSESLFARLRKKIGWNLIITAQK